MTATISTYLRSLVGLLERSDVAETPSSRRCAIVELVQNAVATGVFTKGGLQGRVTRDQLLLPPDRAVCWFSRDPDTLYTVSLLRKCITTEFKLLCKSLAVPCAEWHGIAQAAEIFNSNTATLDTCTHRIPRPTHSPSSDCTRLSFGDFVDVFVSLRSEFVTEHLLNHCHQLDHVISLARNETLFVCRIVSSFNTHSSLLDEFSANEGDTLTHSAPNHPTVDPLHSNTSRPRICEEGELERVQKVVVSELWKSVAVCVRYRMAGSGNHTLVELARKAAKALSKEGISVRLCVLCACLYIHSAHVICWCV